MKRKIKAGTTSHIEHIAIDDNSATDGSGLTGLLWNSASLAAKYKRTGQATWTTITLASATAGTWTSGGFIESDSGAGGEYELHIPDAVLAAGAVGAVVVIYGATNMPPVRIEYELDAIPYQTALGAENGMPVCDANGNVAATLDGEAVAVTFSQSSSQMAAALTGAALRITTHEKLTVYFESLGSLAARTGDDKIWFAVKRNRDDPDDNAVILISEGIGLVRIKGAAAETPGNGDLEVTDEDAGDITITLAEVEAAKLSRGTQLQWALKIRNTTGAVTIREGTATIVKGVIEDYT